LNPELSISCPFVLTLTLMVEDQVKTQNEANLKFMDLEKKSKTSYAKYFPSVEKEVKEWGDIRQRLATNQTSLVSYFFNITTYTPDNVEASLTTEQQVLNSFRKGGLSRMKQHVQVYTDSREGWIKAINHSPEKATAHDILAPRNDRAVKTAELLFGRAKPLDETAAGRAALQQSGLARGVHRVNSFLRGKNTRSRMWRCRRSIKTGKTPVSGSVH
jgi:hypothetical protein